MSDESEEILRQIRRKADEAVKLQNAYARFHERAKEAKAAWEAADEELRELCRSWETSEEVASRPLIRATEQAAATNGEPEMEDEADLADARQALAEVGENGAVPWEDVKESLKSRRRRKAKAGE